MRKKLGTFFVAVVVALVAGELISILLQFILPSGVVKEFLLKSVNFGVPQMTLDFAIFVLNFGLTFHINIISLSVILLVVYYFKWWVK